MSTPRRSFLGRLTALLAIGAAPATLEAAVVGPAAGGARDGARGGNAGGSARWPDERWLEQLANREHKIIIETGVVADGLALRRGLNFIDVMNQDYSIPDDRVGLAIGVHSPALGFLLNDAMWAKYELGKRFAVNAAGAPATANPYRAGAAFTVEALHKRGAQFLACNRALRRLGGELAGPGGNAAAVHAELVANVLPQAIVVPAMVAALSRAQSRGVPYMAVA